MREPLTVCPTCDGEVVVVVVRLEPQVVAMHSCNACDRRWWTADGDVVEPRQHLAKG